MQRIAFLVLFALALSTSGGRAAILYSESFDYGGSFIGFSSNSVGTWTSVSAVLQYDPDTNLSHPGLSATTGGSMWLDFDQARSATDGSININMAGYGAGDSFWFATLFDYVGGNTNHELVFQGGTVTALGFRIDGGGGVSVLASDNGGASNVWHATGVTGVTDGTYLLLARATIGNTFDAFGVDNSVVEFWFNPLNTSSEAALGAATWTTGPDSKFGRASQAITGVFAQPSQQGRIDEIRVATDLFEVITLAPEPSTAMLSALGLLALLGRRRRR